MYFNKKNYKKIQPPILLLSTGRTGSTLIQRVINTSERIIIWGEHNGMLSGIADSYFNILYSKPMNDFYYSNLNDINHSMIDKSYKQYDKNISWLNPFYKEKTHNLYHSFIYSIFNQTDSLDYKKWGFKEILYSTKDRTVDMFFELFPDTKIIFSIRNPLNVIVSMMLAFYSKEKKEFAFANNELDSLRKEIFGYTIRLNKIITSFDKWREINNNNSLIIRYENLIGHQKETINELFNFLDEKVPTNAFEPLKIILENTHDDPFHNEIKSLVINEIPTISKILGHIQDEFNYPLIFNDHYWSTDI
jgi:hypothetical protein